MNLSDLTPIAILVRLGAVLTAYLVARFAADHIILAAGRSLGHDPDRIRGMRAVVHRLLLAGATVTGLLVLGVDLSLLPVYLGSFAAVVGVALFAHWSLLSNLTAGVILFMSRDFAIGSLIRIMAGDSNIEGRIIEFRVFSMVLRRDDGFRVVVPNTLILQHPCACLEHTNISRALAPPPG
jgi:small-conductance mechanosensitive channel